MERIEVKSNKVLGTPKAMATIIKETPWGYIVHVDGDDHEWYGPIDKEGNILSY